LFLSNSDCGIIYLAQNVAFYTALTIARQAIVWLQSQKIFLFRLEAPCSMRAILLVEVL